MKWVKLQKISLEVENFQLLKMSRMLRSIKLPKIQIVNVIMPLVADHILKENKAMTPKTYEERKTTIL